MTPEQRDSVHLDRYRKYREAEKDLQDHRDLHEKQRRQIEAVLINWSDLTQVNRKTLCDKRGAPNTLPLPCEADIAETIAEIERLSVEVYNLKAQLP